MYLLPKFNNEHTQFYLFFGDKQDEPVLTMYSGITSTSSDDNGISSVIQAMSSNLIIVIIIIILHILKVITTTPPHIQS